MAKMSVVVPIYNIEKYLSQCILSICQQTFRDIEIILVDDGSTDRSGIICDEYCVKDERIKVIHKENGGLVSARKAGLKLVTSDYIAYVDGDDWIDADACECMIKDIFKFGTDIVFYGHFDSIGKTDKKILHNILKGKYDKKSLVTDVYPQMISGGEFYSWGLFPAIWGAIYRKEVLVKSQFEVDDEISMGEDAACVYPMALMANSIFVSDKCFYHYRQSSNSMIKTKYEKEIERTKFGRLYKSVNERLQKLSYIYDVTDQWLDYMLFMMIPRADHLLDGYEGLSFLFPFPKVKKGIRLAVYGAGTFGRRLYSYVNEYNYCEIVAWFDRNYVELQNEGLNVISPELIGEYDFDVIVIANMFCKSRRQMYDYVRTKCPNSTIEMIDEKFILSKSILHAFGLD